MLTKTTTIPKPRRWSLSSSGVCAIATAAWGIVAAVYYSRLGLTLAHYDARAHLVVARRVFDSLTPGWQQVGAVWLPLPHVLNALPVQIDALYRNGMSGVAISIASMVLAAWAIARLIHRATGSIAGGAAAAALLMLNPDVLYLQSTPMSEPLLFGTTFLAVALIAEWAAVIEPRTSNLAPRASRLDPRSSRPPSRPDEESRFGGTGPARLSAGPGWACVAAVLTRYEAWPVVGAAIVLAFIVLLRRGWTVGSAARAVRGLALWPLWAVAAFLLNSKVSVGAWVISSGFFVAENPALGHPWLAWTQVWEGLVRLMGPVLPWIAVTSFAGIIVSGRYRDTRGEAVEHSRPSLFLVLALTACAALPLYAYFKGHPLRIRYDVPLVAAAAALTGAGVALLPRRLQPAAGLAVVVLAAWQVPPFDARAPVVIESQRDAANAAGRRLVTAYIETHWNGQPILMSMGSLGHYMHDLSLSGLAVKDFLHEGNGEIWVHAARYPRPFVEWIAIEERAEGGDTLHWQAEHDPNFLKGYLRVAEGGGVALYRRTGEY
jgi:hypothetical protein